MFFAVKLTKHYLNVYLMKFFIAVKTVVVKGRAPVDPECPKVKSAHVYCEGSDVYDAMLNQVLAAQALIGCL